MRRFLVWLMVGLGGGLVALAALAYRLGIDHDRAWGKERVSLALVGAALVAVATLVSRWESLRPRWQVGWGRWRAAWKAWSAGLEGWRWVAWLQRAGTRLANWPGVRSLAQSPARQARLASWGGAACLVLIYTWYMTAGTLTQWHPYFHNYFDRQAQAFLHGQLALLETPDPRLVALDAPYDYDRRTGIPYPWDVAYYQGRFYLYWGPAPALMAAAVRGVTGLAVEDQWLAFGSQLAVGVLLAAHLAALRRRLAPRSSPLGLFVLILAVGANLYLLWPSGRPGVYEAALLSGQAFLLVGLLVLFYGLQAPSRRVVLGVLAGLGLGLAVACRASLVLSVGWCVVGVTVYAWRGRRAGERRWTFAVAFVLPLAVCGGLLLAYNQARFGNPFEEGIRYQLGIPQFPPQPGWLFSPAYLLANFYGIFLRSPEFSSGFPFLTVPYVAEKDWPWFIHLPASYVYQEPQAGWLYLFPLALLGLALLAAMGLGRRTARPSLEETAGVMDDFDRAWAWLLGGAALLQLGALLCYFFSAIRFQIEIVPLAGLLACLGIWKADAGLSRHPVWRRWLWGGVLLLALASLLGGLVGGLSAGEQRFAANNPQLFTILRHWFSARSR